MFEKVYQENLFIMKLLTTQPEFLNDVQEIRTKIKIPLNGFSNEKEKNQWIGHSLEKLNANSDSLRDKNSLFYNADSLRKKYQLRYNFLPHIESYILRNKVDAPKINFDVSLGPDPRGLRHDKWISIKAYAPLSKEEIRQATKKLRELQVEFLPPKTTLDLRPKMDIDLAIKIEQEMIKRMKKIEERPSSYLQAVRRSYGEEEYEKTKKLNPHYMETAIVKYTSIEIAEKLLKDKNKDYFVRKTYSLLQKRRKQLFG
jgi:hypothetical protein